MGCILYLFDYAKNSSFLTGINVGDLGVLIIILVTYVVLGTFLEGLAMLVLTLPIVYPLILELGLSPIWFGVVVVIVLEMGLISPPVGVNRWAESPTRKTLSN